MYPIDIPHTGGIYRITCCTTSKIYIGSTIDLRNRYLGHFNGLRRNDHENPKLQNAFNKYGFNAFQFEVLEYVLLPEMLTAREQYWMDKLKPYERDKGFNLSPTAGNCLGIKLSLEHRAKISASLLGNTHGVGRKDTPETHAKRVTSHLGKKRPPEVCKKIGDAQRGRKATPEQIEKNRLGHLGKPSGTKGVPKTAEHIFKLSKDYIVTSPDGAEFPVHNLNAFCKEHDLSTGHLTQVAQGKRNHHKGWKIRYSDTA